jgi:hypothetical protein
MILKQNNDTPKANNFDKMQILIYTIHHFGPHGTSKVVSNLAILLHMFHFIQHKFEKAGQLFQFLHRYGADLSTVKNV